MDFMRTEPKKVFLITGATGFIGGLLVRALAESGEAAELVLPVRDMGKAKKAFDGLAKNGGLTIHLVEASVEDRAITELAMPIDCILHCASVTQSAEMTAHPVEAADRIVLGTKNILELARKNRVKSMVYLSSMEVYGRVREIGRPRREEELGELDLASARSCYPMGKRMAEHYCHIYQQEYGVPVKIARLAQVFGRGVRQEDNRVYMQFARAVCEGRDIVLKTEGWSMGNYCSSDDAVAGIFTILNRGVDGEAYNVVNEASTMRIFEMAELAANQLAGGRISVKIEPEAGHSYAPDTELRLSGEKLRGLGWRAEKGLIEMYGEVIESIRRRLWKAK